MSSEKAWQRPVEEPREGPGIFGTVLTHQAFGQISASKVSGGSMLYGSDFAHDSYVEIAITRSELHRDGAREFPMARGELISVKLSAAQWARFVSDMNRGDATRCTIGHVMRERMPDLPPPPDRRKLYAGDSAKTAERVQQELAALREELKASGLSAKKLAPMLDRIHQAEMAAGVNQDYVAEQFARHMEKTVQKAAIEINSMLTMAVQGAGLEALQGRGLGAGFLDAPGATPAIDAAPATPKDSHE